jgi:hypothetical protein
MRIRSPKVFRVLTAKPTCTKDLGDAQFYRLSFKDFVSMGDIRYILSRF